MSPLLLKGLGPPLDAEGRQAALADPGPTWKEWFYHEFTRAWMVLGFFVLDSWIVASLLRPPGLYALAPALVGALYLEILAYRYLWTRLPAERAGSSGQPFRRTWLTPVPWGRWTPEAERVRAGLDPYPGRTGPDPREFL
jgi:hypothetical protein